MGSKKQPVDPEIQELMIRPLSTIDDVQAAAKEAASLNAEINRAKDKATHAAAKLKILDAKITAFATAHRAELPIDDNRWQLRCAVVRFSDGGSAVELKRGVSIEDVVVNLRAFKKDLAPAGVNVAEIIKRTEAVSFDDLRAIPARFRARLGYRIVPTNPEPKLLFGANDSKKPPRAASPPRARAAGR